MKVPTNYIYKNRYKLSKMMEISDSFLSQLKAKEIFTLPDIAHMGNVMLLGKEAAACELLRIVASLQSQGYAKWLDALFANNQHEIAKLLTHEAGVSTLYFEYEPFPWVGELHSDESPAERKDSLEWQRWAAPNFRDRISPQTDGVHYETAHVDELPSDEEADYVPQAFLLPGGRVRYYFDKKSVLGKGSTSQVFLGYRDNDPELEVAVKWVYNKTKRKNKFSKCIPH